MSEVTETRQVRGKFLLMRRGKGVLSCLFSGGRAVRFYADPFAESELGNIYVGKIRNVAKNLNAAFVEIGSDKSCFLPLEDAVSPVYTKKGSSAFPQEGDELLVQVSREAIKSKAPALTTKLTIHGKYAVLVYPDQRRSVSTGLSPSERKRLAGLFSELPAEEECRNGWILRTNAALVPQEMIRKEMLRLENQMNRILETGKYRTAYSCLYMQPPAWIRRIEDIHMEEAEEILTDDKELYDQVRTWLSEQYPEDLPRLSFYEDRLLPMENLYRIGTELERALARKVWLPSGGYLVIDPVEALTAIDVNTGKYESKKKKEDTFHKINREAAAEIARQIRLRNLSGIILVDFINEEEEREAELCRYFKNLLEQDPVRTVFVDRTKLHLAEVTRMKKEKTLAEALKDIS